MPEQREKCAAVVQRATNLHDNVLPVGAGDIWGAGEEGERKPGTGGGGLGICVGVSGNTEQYIRPPDYDIAERNSSSGHLCGSRGQRDRSGVSGIEAMLNDFECKCPVYLACGYTNLRRGINGLAGMVEEQFKLDPFQNMLFLFCGRRKDRIKGLYWEGDGFLLLYKRLESGSFQWPRNGTEAQEISA